MAETGAAPIETLYEHLEVFFEVLRGHDFAIGPVERARVLELLTRLAAMDRLPADRTALGRLLAPVIVRSSVEQGEFHRLWRDWAAIPNAPAAEAPLLQAAATPQGRGEPWWRRLWTRPAARRRVIVVSILAVIVAAALAAWLAAWWAWPTPPSTPSDPGNQPGLYGNLPDYLHNLPFEPFPEPEQSPWNRTHRWYVAEYDWQKWLVVLAPFVALGAWLAYLLHAWLAYLRRRQDAERLQPRMLRLAAPALTDLDDPVLRRNLQPLRWRPDGGASDIDVMATAEATARAGGWLQLTLRRRPVANEHLFLIERQDDGDHLWEYGRTLVAIARGAGVAIDVFSFERDVRQLRSERGAMVHLAALARQCPDHHLVVLSDGACLIDGVSGAPAAWAAELGEWRDRVLLTPRPPAEWGPLERMLAARLGIAVIPATPDGLVRLARREASFAPPSGRGRAAAPLSATLFDWLADRPRLWLGRASPGVAMLDRLIAELRATFGRRGFAWLAGMAAYPELRWPLTLRLGAGLQDDDARPLLRLDRLMALSRLPWLRHGRMPDWLRQRLLSELDPADHTAIQKILDGGGARNCRPDRWFALPVFAETDGRAGTDAPRRRDVVFLDFMLNQWRRRSPLALPLRRDLARSLASPPGRRLLWAAGGGSFAAAAAGLLGLALLPIDRCDLLAADPSDVMRVGNGVYQDALKLLPGAVDACETALRRQPDNPRFMYQLGWALDNQERTKEAIPWYERAAAKNYADAFGGLAYIYYNGINVTIDIKKAHELNTKAVQLGSFDSLSALGKIYENYPVLNVSGADPLRLRLEAITKGYPFTWRAASKIFAKSTEADIRQGLELLRIGVARGDPEAANALGYAYHHAEYGLQQDLTEAVRLYQLGARLGQATTTYNLAQLHRYGKGTPVDRQQAARLYLRAVQLGQVDAAHSLASLLAENADLTMPGVNIADLYRYAAEKGNFDAQMALAAAFADGKQGLPKDAEQAANWYRKAEANSRGTETGRKRAKKALTALSSPPPGPAPAPADEPTER